MKPTVYTVRKFRECLKLALDHAENSCVHIKRGEDVFELRRVHEVKEYTHKELNVSLGVPDSYGCGCKREEKKILCPDHERL